MLPKAIAKRLGQKDKEREVALAHIGDCGAVDVDGRGGGGSKKSGAVEIIE